MDQLKTRSKQSQNISHRQEEEGVQGRPDEPMVMIYKKKEKKKERE